MKLNCSIVVSVYKNYDALRLILEALNNQTNTNFEVIIAEDNDAKELKAWLSAVRYNFILKHVSQEDIGFRKCKILNKAVAASSTEYLIFIDGDCIPHPKFVAAHYNSKINNGAIFGRRVMLTKAFSEKVLSNPTLLNHTFLPIMLLINNCKRLDASLYLPFLKPKIKSGIWGCNWSINKQLLLKIGGFDEAYTKPGIGEDVDVTHRLLQHGATILQIKFRAIQYHLWHKENYTDTKQMEAILNRKRSAQTVD
jgi:glycosyltransferase involved in cell wall biosynthesis